MRRSVSNIVMLEVLAVVLVCHPAVAAEEFGIYFDQIAQSQCEVAWPSSLVSMYVLYLDSSVSEISGFEFGISYGEHALVLDIVEPCGQEISDIRQVSVSCETPMPCDSITVLLKFTVVFLTQWEYFIMQAAAEPTAGYDSPLVFLPGGDMLPVGGAGTYATIDGGHEICDGLPVENDSWGSIKAIFR